VRGGVVRNKQQPATWSSKHGVCHTIPGVPWLASCTYTPLFLQQLSESAPCHSRKPIMHTALLLYYLLSLGCLLVVAAANALRDRCGTGAAN